MPGTLRLRHRGRCCPWIAAPLPVRRGSHHKLKFSAICDIGMRKPGLVPRFAVQRRGLNVYVLLRVMTRCNFEGLAVAHVHDHMVEERASENVVRARRINGVETY